MKTWQEHVEAAETILGDATRIQWSSTAIKAANAHIAIAAAIVAGTAMDKAMEDL